MTATRRVHTRNPVLDLRAINRQYQSRRAMPPSPAPVPDLGCVEWTCDQPADPDAPVSLCTQHLRLAFAYVLGQVETRAADAVDTIPPLPTVPRVDTTNGWVYFVEIGPLIKIGWSSYPEQRFKALRPDRVLHLERGSMTDERNLHRLFARLREHGEYFRPHPDLYAFIEQRKAAAA